MSTNLKSLKGRVEIPDTELLKSNYEQRELNLTRFSIEGNSGLQIGFINELGDYCHIQLNNTNCAELRRILNDNF